MGNYHNDHKEQQSLLSKVKAQYEPGPMRHRLYEVFEHHGRPLDPPSYEWMYYAGMGDVDLQKATPQENKAVKELLEQGRLVPTFEDDFYGVKKIRLIQHFDDVKFGIDEKGDILIYDLVNSHDLPDVADFVIRPDKKHEAALKQINTRMDFSVASHAVTVDEQPIQLRGGPVVRPIITDDALIELKRRQRDFANDRKLEA